MTRNKILGYAIGPIGAAVIGFITLPVITWFYSVEDIGRISMLQVTVGFCVMIFTLGLDRAYIREYYEAVDRRKLFKTVFIISVVLSFIICGAMVLYKVDYISNLLYGVNSHYLSLITSVCIILSLASRFLSLILRMEERAIAYSMSQLIPKILFLIFVLTTVLIFSKSSLYWLVSSYSLSIIAVFLMLFWNTRHEVVSSFYEKIDWDLLRRLLSYSLPLVVAGLAAWGLNFTDRILLRKLSTFSELGVYSVAATVAAGVTIFSSIFNTIWSPMVYKWVKDGIDVKKIDEISEHLLAAVFYIVILSGLFSWLIPILLPKEYESVEYLIVVCILAPLLYTLSETTAVGITIVRRTNFAMFASVIALVLNVLGNYFLIPTLGAVGAAISTALSFFAFFILRTEFSKIVWRKIPTNRAYLVITILFVTAIGNALYFKGSIVMIAVWVILGLAGVFYFKKSAYLLFYMTKKTITRVFN